LVALLLCSVQLFFLLMSFLLSSSSLSFFLMMLCPLRSTLFPYTTLFRSVTQGSSQRFEASKPAQWGMALLCTLVFLIAFLIPFRSEEHTSELQSRENLVCRLLLEKKHTGRAMIKILSMV